MQPSATNAADRDVGPIAQSRARRSLAPARLDGRSPFHTKETDERIQEERRRQRAAENGREGQASHASRLLKNSEKSR
jgi:hypothetical protein